MYKRELQEFVESHRDNIRLDLSKLVAVPSISSDKEQVKIALDEVLSLASHMGFQVRTACDHQVGIVEYGNGKETLGILSHVDVVPPESPENWDTNPFTLVEKEGRYYGRGTLDDKGAIVASLYAMLAVKEASEKEKRPLEKKIQLIIGTQEEVEWTDMYAYVKDHKLPDFGFTPDGEFPLCNIEKGVVDVPLLFPLLQEEKSEDGWYVTNFQAGHATNAVPGKAVAQLERWEKGKCVETKDVDAIGKGVHSCQPEKGENAIFLLIKKIAAYNPVENQLWRILSMTQKYFASMFGKELGLYSEKDTYNGEFVHRNAFAPTLFKIEEEQIRVHINVRFAYGTESEEIVARLTTLAEEYSGTLGAIDAMPAVYISKNRPFMKAFAEAYEEGSGLENRFELAYGGSYAKAMPNIVSWGPIFPGEEDTCHEDNEYINIDSLEKNTLIFAIALNKIVFSKENFK